MSAGHVHQKASVFLSLGFMVTCILTLDVTNVLYSIGSLIGIILTPDLDVDNGFIGNTIIRKRVGYFAEYIWDGVWYLYRRSLKHGSPLSHFPVISTLGRIFYIFFIFIVLPHSLFSFLFSPSWDLQYVLNWYWESIMSNTKIIFGLMCSDIIHWALDVCTTEHSPKKRA